MALYSSLFKLRLGIASKSLYVSNIKLTRSFQTSTLHRSLSNPFKPKDSKKNDQDIKEFMTEKKEKVIYKDNVLAKIVKRFSAPQPLNTKFREMFKLDEDYKLVYWVQKERFFLINFSVINSIYPIVVVLINFMIYAELVGIAQFSQSFENPIQNMSFFLAWFSFIFGIARLNQATTVFRIYYNDKTKKYVLIRLIRFAKFEKQEFTGDMVKYRFVNKLDNSFEQLKKSMSKNIGNMYIDGKLRNIELKNFTSDEAAKNFLGIQAFDSMRSHKEL